MSSKVDTQSFKCADCDKVFSGQIKLLKHVKAVHEKVKLVPSEDCERTFLIDSEIKTDPEHLKENTALETKKSKENKTCES